MLLTETTMKIVLGITGVVVAGGFVFLLWRVKAGVRAFLFFPLMSFAAIFFLCRGFFRTVYVIDKNWRLTTYESLGASKLETDGKSLGIDVPSGHCLVVNYSSSPAQVNRIEYAMVTLGFGGGGASQKIRPGEHFLVDRPEIDYLPGESVPDEIKVSEGTFSSSRYQLVIYYAQEADTSNREEPAADTARH